MNPRKLLLYAAVGLGGVAFLLVTPFAFAAAARLLAPKDAHGMSATDASVIGFAVGTIATLILAAVAIVGGTRVVERKSRERLRRYGSGCVAVVKTYRRVSVTEHRVLFLVQFPSGPRGLEYTMSGLADGWLADVCAQQSAIRVIAHPDAKTILIE